MEFVELAKYGVVGLSIASIGAVVYFAMFAMKWASSELARERRYHEARYVAVETRQDIFFDVVLQHLGADERERARLKSELEKRNEEALRHFPKRDSDSRAS